MKKNSLKQLSSELCILFSIGNSAQINGMGVLAGLFNILCFIIITLKAVTKPESSFPAYNISAIFIFIMLCFISFLRMYFNKTSPRFIKTLKNSKSIYTKRLSFMYEVINSFIVLFTLAGVFFCYSKGFDSYMYYLVIIVFLFQHIFVSVVIPFFALYLKSEEKIYLHNLNGQISFNAIFIFLEMVIYILPVLLISFFVKPFSEFFKPLSSNGLLIISALSIFIMKISCSLNHLIFLRVYNRR